MEWTNGRVPWFTAKLIAALSAQPGKCQDSEGKLYSGFEEREDNYTETPRNNGGEICDLSSAEDRRAVCAMVQLQCRVEHCREADSGRVAVPDDALYDALDRTEHLSGTRSHSLRRPASAAPAQEVLPAANLTAGAGQSVCVRFGSCEHLESARFLCPHW